MSKQQATSLPVAQRCIVWHAVGLIALDIGKNLLQKQLNKEVDSRILEKVTEVVSETFNEILSSINRRTLLYLLLCLLSIAVIVLQDVQFFRQYVRLPLFIAIVALSAIIVFTGMKAASEIYFLSLHWEVVLKENIEKALEEEKRGNLLSNILLTMADKDLDHVLYLTTHQAFKESLRWLHSHKLILLVRLVALVMVILAYEILFSQLLNAVDLPL